MFKRPNGTPSIKKLRLSRVVTRQTNQVAVVLVVVVVTTLPSRHPLQIKEFLNYVAMPKISIRMMIIAAVILVSHSQT